MEGPSRLRALGSVYRPDDKEPRFMVVLENQDGIWRAEQGSVVDPESAGQMPNAGAVIVVAH